LDLGSIRRPKASPHVKNVQISQDNLPQMTHPQQSTNKKKTACKGRLMIQPRQAANVQKEMLLPGSNCAS
jgi:hypothetical protein